MPNPRTRRTVMPLTGTYRRVEAHLSLTAYLSLRLAMEHLGRAHAQRPTASAVCRLALADLCKRLETMNPTDRSQMAARVLSASKAFKPDPDDAERAQAALDALGEGDPLPSFQNVLAGPSGPLDVAALEAKVSAHLRAIGPRRFKDGL